MNENRQGIILEMNTVREERAMAAAKEALAQIETNAYQSELARQGCGRSGSTVLPFAGKRFGWNRSEALVFTRV